MSGSHEPRGDTPHTSSALSRPPACFTAATGLVKTPYNFPRLGRSTLRLRGWGEGGLITTVKPTAFPSLNASRAFVRFECGSHGGHVMRCGHIGAASQRTCYAARCFPALQLCDHKPGMYWHRGRNGFSPPLQKWFNHPALLLTNCLTRSSCDFTGTSFVRCENPVFKSVGVVSQALDESGAAFQNGVSP